MPLMWATHKGFFSGLLALHVVFREQVHCEVRKQHYGAVTLQEVLAAQLF